MSQLTVSNLVVRRGNKAVANDLSITVESGSITALLGPNGAGKSSLVLALAGVLPVEQGSVTIDGVTLTGRSPEAVRRAGLAAVPEGHRVLAGLNVDDNLRAAGFSHSPTALRPILDEVYATLPELAERRPQKAGSMSGGQQQMLAIGQALVARPAFVLIDEMSLGLAPLIVKRLMGVLDNLAASGVGVLLIEQFTHLALKHANRAYVMNHGRIVYDGLAEEIRERPEILHGAYLAG